MKNILIHVETLSSTSLHPVTLAYEYSIIYIIYLVLFAAVLTQYTYWGMIPGTDVKEASCSFLGDSHSC